MISKEAVDKMMDAGYERAKGVLERVFANGIEDLDHIYSTITELNTENPKKKIRFTVDTIITGLNKVGKKITKIQKP